MLWDNWIVEEGCFKMKEKGAGIFIGNFKSSLYPLSNSEI